MIPGVAIIVLNFNGWKDTLECLESIYRLDYANYEVILVDNGSTDSSVERVQAWARGEQAVIYQQHTQLKYLTEPPIEKPLELGLLNVSQLDGSKASFAEHETIRNSKKRKLTVIVSSQNLGYAGGNNMGLKYALKNDDYKYFWLVNNDTVVTPLSLNRLVGRMEESPRLGMGGVTLLYYHHPDRVQAMGGAKYNRWLALAKHIGLLESLPDKINRKEVETRLSYVNGAAMLVSREFIEKVGLMKEDYFLYFEELDWITRAGEQFKIVYAPESIVYHKEGGTINPEETANRKSRLADFYWHRNRLIFTRRYFPQALPLVYLSFLGVLFNRVIRGQWDRMAMITRIIVGFLAGKKISYPFEE